MGVVVVFRICVSFELAGRGGLPALEFSTDVGVGFGEAIEALAWRPVHGPVEDRVRCFV